MNTSFTSDITRRMIERKHYLREMSFSAGPMMFAGVVQNISMRGACISSGNTSKIKRGLEIGVAIPFARKQGSMKRKAFVRWAAKDRFGIQFASRKNDRTNHPMQVYLSAGSVIARGTLQNISLKGACVHSPHHAGIAAGKVVTVAIPHVRRRSRLRRNGVVKWVAGDRFGIQFI